MERHLHDPIEDHLVPLEPLDLSQVRSIDDLVRAMSKTAFTGRQLGEAADVLEAMARDRDCFVVMTLAGAMTVAKQGLVITELIDRGIVNAIVSTGALMAHGLVEATGRAHFRYNPEVSDERLYEQGYNRVTTRSSPNRTWTTCCRFRVGGSGPSATTASRRVSCSNSSPRLPSSTAPGPRRSRSPGRSAVRSRGASPARITGSTR